MSSNTLGDDGKPSSDSSNKADTIDVGGSYSDVEGVQTVTPSSPECPKKRRRTRRIDFAMQLAVAEDKAGLIPDHPPECREDHQLAELQRRQAIVTKNFQERTKEILDEIHIDPNEAQATLQRYRSRQQVDDFFDDAYPDFRNNIEESAAVGTSTTHF